MLSKSKIYIVDKFIMNFKLNQFKFKTIYKFIWNVFVSTYYWTFICFINIHLSRHYYWLVHSLDKIPFAIWLFHSVCKFAISTSLYFRVFTPCPNFVLNFSNIYKQILCTKVLHSFSALKICDGNFLAKGNRLKCCL